MLEKLSPDLYIEELKKPNPHSDWKMIQRFETEEFEKGNIDFFADVLEKLSEKDDHYKIHCLKIVALINSKRALRIVIDGCESIDYFARYTIRDLAARLAFSRAFSYLEDESDLSFKFPHTNDLVVFGTIEYVLRGNALKEKGSLLNFFEQNQRRFYKDLRLPPKLMALESNQPNHANEYGPNFSNGWDGFAYHIDTAKEKFVLNNVDIKKGFAEIIDPMEIKLILAASRRDFVENHLDVEARVFKFEAPVDDPETVLRSLPLHCIALDYENDELDPELLQTTPIWIVDTCGQSVFDSLMGLASSGAPLENGSFGSIGRELAWKTMAGLCGELSLNPDKIQTAVGKCRFYFFVTESDFFYHRCTDMGIMCIREDQRSVSFFAYSDCS